MKPMKIYVTGGAGFVGRAVVQTLHKRGHEVYALVRNAAATRVTFPPGVVLVSGDLANVDTQSDMLRDLQPQALVHLAWEGLPDYSEAMSQKNLAMGTALYELAAASGVKTFVSTGSCWEYASRQGAMAEDALLGESKAFPVAKSALRKMGLDLAKKRGLAFYWLRLFYVYGPGQHAHSLLPTLIAAARRGQEPGIRMPGNRNDFVHVDDVALALALVLECCPKADTYNVGTGVATRVADVASLVYKTLAKPLPEGLAQFLAETTPPPPTEDFWADTTRLADTGFTPQIGLGEGIADMLRHAEARPEDGAQ
jgi:UDP-glucose 4-epimerase